MESSDQFGILWIRKYFYSHFKDDINRYKLLNIFSNLSKIKELVNILSGIVEFLSHCFYSLNKIASFEQPKEGL